MFVRFVHPSPTVHMRTSEPNNILIMFFCFPRSESYWRRCKEWNPYRRSLYYYVFAMEWLTEWVGWASENGKVMNKLGSIYRGFGGATYRHRKRRFWFYAKTHKMSFSFVGLSSSAVVYCTAKGLLLNRRQWMDMSTKLLSCHCGVAWEGRAKVADCRILYYFHIASSPLCHYSWSLVLSLLGSLAWPVSVLWYRLRAIIVFYAGVQSKEQ